jgi:hypothetical protein
MSISRDKGLNDIRKLQEFSGIISGLRYKRDKVIGPIKIN